MGIDFDSEIYDVKQISFLGDFEVIEKIEDDVLDFIRTRDDLVLLKNRTSEKDDEFRLDLDIQCNTYDGFVKLESLIWELVRENVLIKWE